MEVRLNKFISDSGMCSRRQADRLIELRKVTINGKVAVMGDKVRKGDRVCVSGNHLDYQHDTVYIALNKPIGIVSTTDPSDANNIIDYVNFPMRVFNVGRLDKDSEGLILLTNDGDIVNKILRAENNHDKEYEVGVNKPITDKFLAKMSDGVSILGVMTRKCEVVQTGTHSFKITLRQGLNRQIRRMCEALDYEVIALRRIRIMNISLGKLPVGHWRLLEDREIDELNQSLSSSKGEGVALKKKSSARKFPRKKPAFLTQSDESKSEQKKISKNGVRRSSTVKGKPSVKSKPASKSKYVPKKRG